MAAKHIVLTEKNGGMKDLMVLYGDYIIIMAVKGFFVHIKDAGLELVAL